MSARAIDVLRHQLAAALALGDRVAAILLAARLRKALEG